MIEVTCYLLLLNKSIKPYIFDSMDIYQSHEGELFCKPHFKELFKPKAVLENAEEEPRKCIPLLALFLDS